MSGFLNRLAASVVQRQPRLHPFVESIYGSSPRADAPAGFVLQTEISEAGIPAGPVPAAGPVLRPSAPSQAPATVVQAGTPAPGARTAQAAAKAGIVTAAPPATAADPAAAAFAALLPVSPLLPPAVLRQPETTPPQAISPQQTANAADPAAALAMPASRPQAAASDMWIYQPLIANIANAMKAPGDPRPADATKPPPPFPAGIPARPALPAAPRRAPAPQPEDIQIHIGRIEVIAVPPPRAAPATARKGPTLDEYLGTSSRRAR